MSWMTPPRPAPAVPVSAVTAGLRPEPGEQRPVAALRSQPSLGEFGLQYPDALVDLDQQHLAHLGEAGHAVGAEQPAPVNGHQVVADLLDLPEQVRGHDDGNAELRADPADQVEHRGPPGRIEPDGR